MSTPVTAPARPTPGTGSGSPARGLVRRHRSTALIVLAALAAVLTAALLGAGHDTSAAMDPDNPGPDGTRALARVLARDGVDVTVARGAEELDRARVDADTTVVVTRPDRLGDSTIDRLAADTRGAADVVVVGAGPGVVRALGVDAPPDRVGVGDGRPAGCPDPRFAGLRLEVDRSVSYPGGDCFAARAHGRTTALVTTADAGIAARGAPLLLFGADQALTNDQVLRADNAAVALRLLGQHRHLVWYVPSLDDLVAGDGVSLQSLLPAWLQPGLWLGALALVALVVWRARRLGPLATEPLPVVVRAIETTHSLGRLYRRSGDRAHAAETLRRAARRRLATRLRLGSSATPEAVVREVARRTGRSHDDVARLIGPTADVPSTVTPGGRPTDPSTDPSSDPSSDADLIALADALAQLDEEVPRT